MLIDSIVYIWQIQSEFMLDTVELLRDGWEPFAIAHVGDLRDQMVYLRKKVVAQ